MASAITVRGLARSYGAVRAVRGVSFTVGRGEIFALLGPNGAGKTTTLEILEGFRRRDGGQADVLGLDPGNRATGRALRERIGLVLQDIAVEPYLTVRETLARNAGYYLPIHSALLNRISGWLPVRPFNQALLGPFAQHGGVDWKDLGVLRAWGSAGALVAIWRFRWDPRAG